jgi:DNA-binding MarR family transcriptional regulator
MVAFYGALVAQTTTLPSFNERWTVITQARDARLREWWTFMAAHALLVQQVARDLAAETYLPLASYNVLHLLHEAPSSRLRLSELATAVHLTRSGLTRLADRLESGGLLHREGHARDRRESWAVLTDRGREELKRARTVFVRAVREHFGSYLSDGEAETLNVALSRMVKAETGADSQ